MKTIIPSNIPIADLQNYLQSAIAPRPICFASTIDNAGNVNLSPFSFFNMVSTNPPMCIFSPSRRVRDNATKHTLDNLIEVPEVVINIVNYGMVQQTSLASTEYPKGENEFLKAGFTELKSELVKPPRVAESPVQMECTVKDIISLGETPGAGNLVLAEVKLIHISESIIGEDGKIDQEKIDLVARLGGDWYCRANSASLFKVAKPLTTKGIGVDKIPAFIRNSKILSGNNLGQLGNVEALPSDEEIEEMRQNYTIKEILDATIGDAQNRGNHLQVLAKQMLDSGDVVNAWKVLLIMQ